MHIKHSQRTIYWFGEINHGNAQRALEQITELAKENPESETYLFICSPGGDTDVALAFFDAVRTFNPNLTTVACGHVGKAAVLVWLAGHVRLITRHTTILLSTAEELSAVEHAQESYRKIVERVSFTCKEELAKLPYKRDRVLIDPKQAVALNLATGRMKT